MLKKTLEELKKITVEVFGLGYVGFPLAVRLASAGVKVIGIDTNPKRIERLENNLLMESELYLKNEFLQNKKNGNLTLSLSPNKLDFAKIAIICVHTPISTKNEKSNTFVDEAVTNFLNSSKEGDVIIIESSVSGGTTERIQKMIEEKGFSVGENFGLCFCPERIDPQNKKWNLENIPRIVYCSDDTTFAIIQKIYHNVNHANLKRVSSPKVAEVVKSYENAFRLVNISLVNELAVLCDKLKINVKDVIDAAATKPFGFMPFYPSAGAGGHCIPKDPLFLLEAAKKLELEFSTIENAIKINKEIPKYICNSIKKSLDELKLEKTVLVCGLTYKKDVEDMRDSPGFKLVKEMSENGYNVSIFDPYYKPELLEKYLIENHIQDLKINQKNDLESASLNGINCICIVQHHTKNSHRLREIYEKSQVPLIYDCQRELQLKQNSKTSLEFFGA